MFNLFTEMLLNSSLICMTNALCVSELSQLYAIMLMYLRKGYASGNSKLRGKKLSKMRKSTTAVASRWLELDKDCQVVFENQVQAAVM